MRTARRNDADAIRAALTGRDVIAHFELDGRRAGTQWRTRTCPACGPRSRDAVTIDLATGRWFDHAHGCAGDGLALVASLAGLDARHDFRRVLDRAAAIAGLDITDADLATRQRVARDAAAARRAADVAREVATRADAIKRARALWLRLDRDHARGRAYLDGRGLDGSALVAADALRFRRDGSPAVALRDIDGAIVNVATRWIEPTCGRKVTGLRDCTTAGTLVGAVAEIAGGTEVVLAEGVVDALAARLAWPRAIVLGAHGAGRYAAIAKLAAPRVKLARGRLLLCADADPIGERVGVDAGRAALDAGLELDLDLLVVDFGAAHDLADAWCDGWRP